MNRLVVGLVGAVVLGWTGSALACAPGQDFDSCFFDQLGQMQQNNALGMQQTWGMYLQAYGPQLEQAYQEWGRQTGASFEQFAYFMLMSANGTDIAGALAAQRANFKGIQDAHNSQVQAGQTLIEGGKAASDAGINAVEGFDTGAVRGNVVLNGPNGPIELPYSNMQVGQTVEADGYTFKVTPEGYSVWDGHRWMPMQ